MEKKFLRLTIFLGVLLLMSSCASMMTSMDLKNAQTKTAEHKYSEAITLAASALVRSEGQNTEAADLIIEAVNQGDAYYNGLVKQYRQLSKEDNPLANIYRAYEALAEMYVVVSNNNLTNFTAGGMNYSVKIKDYTTELDTAREDAGKAYYDAAVRKMGEGTLAGYRTAYANLNFVKSIYANTSIPFNDIDERMKTAHSEGTIDIYFVVPADLNMSANEGSMGDYLQQNLYPDGDWIEFHCGPKIDLAYQAWKAANSGKNYWDSTTGLIKGCKGVIEFGNEVDADIVIYAAFDNLQSDEIKVSNYNDKFGGTSEGVDFVLDLDWSRYSKQTSIDYTYSVVDVKARKSLETTIKGNSTNDIVFYTGTYTITPDIWSIITTKNIAELLDIKDIKKYRYANSGYNGWAYRINYSSAELELRDKTHFDEGLEKFKNNAQAEAEYITVMNVKSYISDAMADYL